MTPPLVNNSAILEQSFIFQETEQFKFISQSTRMAETEKERHLKIDGREDLDQILKEMTRNETTHKQVQPCSRDREGQRLRPYVS